ncbi:acyl-CoA dehydrogenase [Allosaccharopolyspora coralli]|uniref:Acyl-CoA dehydrogenase n=1 Tax=Allosaccharopolyspora coralli TaxID=2665642 RepID=A0A5Q3QAF6_9PSEU|nr:acyl-CoA dehydrogenase family protein [Allosaccharopolyspora coralli]QGK70346.1 acyl-CoA dehydrogenase [Allosaccharopolyspora coralli]
MHFAFTDEQDELRTVLRSLLDRSGPPHPGSPDSPSAGYDPELWRRLADDIGACGLAIPETYGGAGYTLVETGVAVEELGRMLSSAPLFGSAVVAAEALLASGDDAACKRALPGISDGSTIATLAWAEAAHRWSTTDCETTAVPDARRGWTLHGRKDFVLDAAHADLVLVVARTDAGLTLFELDPAVIPDTRLDATTLDATRTLGGFDLREAPARLIGTTGGAQPVLERVRDVAAAVLAAEQFGAAQRWLGETIEYTKVRTQFNRPIGSFQALKHRLADLYVAVESARSVSAAALWAVATHAPEAPEWAAMAKSWCSDTYADVAAEGIQLHGGIGVTWEHEAHLHLKRAHSSAALFGGPRDHRARLADLVAR